MLVTIKRREVIKSHQKLVGYSGNASEFSPAFFGAAMTDLIFCRLKLKLCNHNNDYLYEKLSPYRYF